MFISFSPYIHINPQLLYNRKTRKFRRERTFIRHSCTRETERKSEREKSGRMKNGLSKHDAIAGAVSLGY